MSKTLDELLGLIDRFAMLHADAREARVDNNRSPSAVAFTAEAKEAHEAVESALRELIADAERIDWFDTFPTHKLARIRADIMGGTLTVRHAIDTARDAQRTKAGSI